MTEIRLQGLLGLCVRARQATFGMDGCLKVIRQGQCAVLVMEKTASEATRRKYESTCRSADVPILMVEEGTIEQATNRPGVAMAIASGGLSEKILRIHTQDDHRLTTNGGGASV